MDEERWIHVGWTRGSQSLVACAQCGALYRGNSNIVHKCLVEELPTTFTENPAYSSPWRVEGTTIYSKDDIIVGFALSRWHNDPAAPANARLMGAAPTLFEALQSAYAYIEKRPQSHERAKLLLEIRQALEAAR